MARPLRIDPAGAIHHITQHANRHGDCFLDDRDRRFFLSMVGDACEEHEAKVIALCLMGNHFHLLVRFPEGGISAFMQRITSSYVRWFNEWHVYRGPLFDDRFHSELVATDEHLLGTVRYLARNPLEMTYRVETYRWSTHQIYLGLKRCPHWIDSRRVLEMLGGHDRYRKFVETDLGSDQVPWSAGVRDMPVVPAVERPSLDIGEVDRSVADLAGCEPSAIVSQGRNNTPRLVALLIASDSQRYPPEDVAAHYGFSSKASLRSAVSRARRLATENRDVAALWTAALR